MSKLDLTILKPNNAPWQLMFTLSNDFFRRYDRFTIEVRHGNEPLDIYSTTAGSIKRYKIYLNERASTISYCTAYNTGVRNLETIIAFYYQNDIIHQEIISSTIDYVDTTSVPKIRAISLDVTELDVLKIDKICKNEVAGFQVKLEVSSDIRVDVSNVDDVYLVFGDTASSVISCSDLIFSVEAGTSYVNIPKEIVWMNYKNYNVDLLGCHELVKLDCLDYIYHKILASNTIHISDCIKKRTMNLSHFRTPTGSKFSDKWEINNYSQLPCQKP